MRRLLLLLWCCCGRTCGIHRSASAAIASLSFFLVFFKSSELYFVAVELDRDCFEFRFLRSFCKICLFSARFVCTDCGIDPRLAGTRRPFSSLLRCSPATGSSICRIGLRKFFPPLENACGFGVPRSLSSSQFLCASGQFCSHCP